MAEHYGQVFSKILLFPACHKTSTNPLLVDAFCTGIWTINTVCCTWFVKLWNDPTLGHMEREIQLFLTPEETRHGLISHIDSGFFNTKSCDCDRKTMATNCHRATGKRDAEWSGALLPPTPSKDHLCLKYQMGSACLPPPFCPPPTQNGSDGEGCVCATVRYPARLSVLHPL